MNDAGCTLYIMITVCERDIREPRSAPDSDLSRASIERASNFVNLIKIGLIIIYKHFRAPFHRYKKCTPLRDTLLAAFLAKE